MDREVHACREIDSKFEFFFNRLENLLNSSVPGRTLLGETAITCWSAAREHVPGGGSARRNYRTRRNSSLDRAPEGRGSPSLGGENGLYLKGSICGIPVQYLADYRCKRYSFKTDLAQKIGRNNLFTQS
ncbi:hypothetical protein AVEN_16580-1 [Araneus ventricosus]|uniref:Uncharacterized protein n=1 Tax=Araneus ventricosus TaxID=182803 RepID=A0A4Y2JQ78_ARAVE|nr:hypothetical protein AVEN_16580-1 [Araneus ventricosus]